MDISSLVRETANNGTQSTTSNIFTWVVLGVLGLAFVGFFIWSNYNNKKQQKKHTEKLKSLDAGTRVITRGGVSGIVESVNLNEGTFVLKTGTPENTTYLTFVLEAIYLSGPDADKAAQQAASKLSPTAPIQENKTNTENKPPLQ